MLCALKGADNRFRLGSLVAQHILSVTAFLARLFKVYVDRIVFKVYTFSAQANQHLRHL